MRLTFKKLLATSILTLGGYFTLSFTHPQPALACACCANAGTWFERSHIVQDFQLEILNDLVFGDANLYRTGTREIVEGLESPQLTYRLSKSSNGRSWNLRFIGDDGETAGNLSFFLPEEMISFGADLFNDPMPDTRLEREIYREIRFEGNIAGNGIFAAIPNETQFKLVLKGNGGVCPTAMEFQNWVLDVSGPGVDFSFYGELNGGN
jgi:hypothetical protein